MTSSKHYKMWIRNGAAWSELAYFMNLKFQDGVNIIPSMSVTIVTVDSALQSLMKAGVMFRITNTDSVNGTVATLRNGKASGEGGAGREVMTGLLETADGDDKAAIRNNMSVFWQISGFGFAGTLAGHRYERDQPYTTTFCSAIISTDANSIINQINTQAGATVISAGTIDAGPQISLLLRNDEVIPLLYDIAQIGDTPTQQLYMIEVDQTAALAPRLNYLSSTNAQFTTTNPFSVADEARILNEATECRSVRTIDERGRIRNAIRVRYRGIGTGGDGQADGTVVTDATSITNFRRKEALVHAPLIQDLATADMYANTLLNMYKGSANGLRRIEVVAKSGQLFSTEFNAKLYDVVGVRLRTGTELTGRLFQYTYDQNTESLSYVIGLPQIPFFNEITSFNRRFRQAVSAMDETVAKPTEFQPGAIVATTGAPVAVNPGAGLVTILQHTSPPANFGQAEGWWFALTLNPSASTPIATASHTHDLSAHTHTYDKANTTANDGSGTTGGANSGLAGADPHTHSTPAHVHSITGHVATASAGANPNASGSGTGAATIQGPFTVEVYAVFGGTTVGPLCSWYVAYLVAGENHNMSGFWPWAVANAGIFTPTTLQVKMVCHGTVGVTIGTASGCNFYKVPLHLHDF